MLGKAVWAIANQNHPVLVHLIPMRRCNLTCTYCNEYDAISKPVPIDLMLRRLDLLADLGTSMITVSGGEPLMHPELDAMIVHMRRRGMVASIITNGYYLNQERIERLNDAGLDYLQITTSLLRVERNQPRRGVMQHSGAHTRERRQRGVHIGK